MEIIDAAKNTAPGSADDPMLAYAPRYRSFEETYANLRVGDIVLVNRKKGFYQKALKRVTGESYWNHMALVFAVLDIGDREREVIIIEARERGIEIHRLQRYLRDEKRFDVGFKRLPGLTDRERERIRGFFLDSVDIPYNYSSAIAYLIKKPIMQLLGMRVTDFIERRVIKPHYFVCTSFAQRAFYMAMPPNEREKTLFIPDDESTRQLNFLYQLIEITPDDVAKSKNYEWLYQVRF